MRPGRLLRPWNGERAERENDEEYREGSQTSHVVFSVVWLQQFVQQIGGL